MDVYNLLEVNMKLLKLLRYSLYLLLITLGVFFILTLYMYYFSKQPSIEVAYRFVVPVCMFIVTLLYARSVHEKGLLRGLEIWVVYFAFILLLKVLFKYPAEISILSNLLYLPVTILGGILGVNMKQRKFQ